MPEEPEAQGAEFVKPLIQLLGNWGGNESTPTLQPTRLISAPLSRLQR